MRKPGFFTKQSKSRLDNLQLRHAAVQRLSNLGLHQPQPAGPHVEATQLQQARQDVHVSAGQRSAAAMMQTAGGSEMWQPVGWAAVNTCSALHINVWGAVSGERSAASVCQAARVPQRQR